MRYIKFSLGLILFFPLFSYCQNQGMVHVEGLINSNRLKTFNIEKLGLRDQLSSDPDTEINIIPYKPFKADFKMSGSGLYKLGDGWFGHRIFLEQGDTVYIKLTELPNVEKRLQNGENLTKFHIMKVKAKYPGNLTFFDEMEKEIGFAIKYGTIKNETPLQYEKRCDNAYDTALNLLTQYEHEKIVSEGFVKCALADLSARYTLWLCEIFFYIPKNKIPDSFFSTVNKFSFNDSAFATASDKYLTAAAVYNGYIYNNYDDNKPFSNLKNEFSTIVQNYSGIVKDKLMAYELGMYLGKESPDFDSLYNVFLIQCKNENIKNDLINKVRADRLLPKKKANDKVDFDSLLSRTIILDINNKLFALQDILLKNKICVIDCWASWCGPCKEQLPFIRDIEKKYKDSVQFIFLSFDKDEIKWKSSIQKDKTDVQNQYLVSNNFESLFTKYFQIEAIPRYILLSKNGKTVLESNMPFPALSDEFEQKIKEHLGGN